MGKKIDPRLFRLGIINNWNGRWLNQKQYPILLKQDYELRNFLYEKLKDANIERIIIERSANLINVIILTSRAGLIIGRGGAGIEDIKQYLEKIIQKNEATKQSKLRLEIQEIKEPDTSAPLIAQNIASQLERRIPFRRILKQTLDRVFQNKIIQGIKISISGRLNGAEMSRREWVVKGKIPLQTIRADIDFGKANSYTKYGVIGVKVWLYKGEVFEEDEVENK